VPGDGLRYFELEWNSNPVQPDPWVVKTVVDQVEGNIKGELKKSEELVKQFEEFQVGVMNGLSHTEGSLDVNPKQPERNDDSPFYAGGVSLAKGKSSGSDILHLKPFIDRLPKELHTASQAKYGKDFSSICEDEQLKRTANFVPHPAGDSYAIEMALVNSARHKLGLEELSPRSGRRF